MPRVKLLKTGMNLEINRFNSIPNRKSYPTTLSGDPEGVHTAEVVPIFGADPRVLFGYFNSFLLTVDVVVFVVIDKAEVIHSCLRQRTVSCVEIF